MEDHYEAISRAADLWGHASSGVLAFGVVAEGIGFALELWKHRRWTRTATFEFVALLAFASLAAVDWHVATLDKQKDEIAEQRAAPRRLTEAQAGAITKTLMSRGQGVIKSVSVTSGDEEANDFALQLIKVVSGAGWQAPPFATQMMIAGMHPVGLIVEVHDHNHAPIAAIALVDALRSAGVECRGAEVPGIASDEMDVVVGRKP